MMKKHTCQNGVRVVLESIPTVRSVTIGIWIGVGSRDEDEKNNGISHFLEHMFFKGTNTRTAKEIAESFDSIGGQVNAFTAKEYTCIYAKVLDNHATYALDVLADMFFYSTFNEQELKKEKNVVLEEIKMYEDTPDDIVHDMLSKAAYHNHPLGFPILGTEETLDTFTSDMLHQYIHDMYTPDNIVISVAGNIDDNFIYQIENHFGSFERGKNKISNEKPIFYSEQVAKQKKTEQAHLCLGFEGLPIGSEKIYDLIVMNIIFGGGMSSRLFQEVREERGLAYSVFSYHSSYKDTGTLVIYGGTAAHQLDELQDTIFSTLAQFKNNGISQKELKNSKEQLKGNLMLSLESTNSRMGRIGKNELLLKKHRSLDEIISDIDRVTVDSVYQLTSEIFTDDFTSALISPHSQSMSKAIY
ncbi:M16 family metallopeptidase [Lederbergia galactosidilytica]|uniref:Zinc protease n=1 Tax=Lederbergia galactosidilytica TaxID=217031 RepID=A0A177ZXD5_9BACI|nr:pitrilysin family protein [Lederbergia galactosidilytica]MBP1913606.1 putative Zn-dependent peptidase [Lederbergia galactosidilytica]OAK72514.1 zinc protease [Lederbergia galactosidilytica]